ncbi:hypothetical protein OROHE_003541 [Orobanche hederae]
MDSEQLFSDRKEKREDGNGGWIFSAKFDNLTALISDLERGKGKKVDGGQSPGAANNGQRSAGGSVANLHGQEGMTATFSAEDGVLAATTCRTLPGFDGEDWISRAEQYFLLRRTAEADKVEVAFIAMDGGALYWFQWTQYRFPELTWAQLKQELLRR